ncbi:hypothetical protein D3C80_1671160 [compost metagenome]
MTAHDDVGELVLGSGVGGHAQGGRARTGVDHRFVEEPGLDQRPFTQVLRRRELVGQMFRQAVPGFAQPSELVAMGGVRAVLDVSQQVVPAALKARGGKAGPLRRHDAGFGVPGEGGGVVHQ